LVGVKILGLGGAWPPSLVAPM
jgi:hypothetical protein